MPRLNERKEPRIDTFVKLTIECRQRLESAIGHDGIKSLTDAIEESSKLLTAKIKRRKPPETRSPE